MADGGGIEPLTFRSPRFSGPVAGLSAAPSLDGGSVRPLKCKKAQRVPWAVLPPRPRYRLEGITGPASHADSYLSTLSLVRCRPLYKRHDMQTDFVSVNAYFRIRYGNIEHVREHIRRRWRWAMRGATAPLPSDQK